jgi:TonB family protein
MAGRVENGSARGGGYIRSMASFLRGAASVSLVATLAIPGCMDQDTSQKVAQAFQAGPVKPDEIPIRTGDLPFHYPPALYARKIQGNVTLRLYIDRNGQVTPDSTRIEESSGYAALDSAAVKGSQDLHFVPAKVHGDPLGVSILFPVYFRHPEAHALPGDTILKSMQPKAASGER